MSAHTDTMLNRPLRLNAEEILTEEAINHVLEGSGGPDYLGGHRFTSTVVGKTVFPEQWTDEDIVAALHSTINTPATVISTRQDLILFGVIGEVLVEVHLTRAKRSWRFVTAFPKCGTSVFRNDPLNRTHIPLDLSYLEH